MLAAAALLVLPVAAADLTLMQREYGDTNAGLDDGQEYDGWDQPGDPAAPGFATGYLLTDAAEKTDAKCLDG